MFDDSSYTPSKYGCDILLEKTTIERAKDKSFPNDAYLVWYVVDGQEYIDLTRGSRVRIFDLYYDRYGPNSLKRIDFGYGRTNQKLWGNKKSSDKNKKRK